MVDYEQKPDISVVENIAIDPKRNYEEIILPPLDPPVTEQEEKAVRRKFDMRVPPFLALIYLFSWLDRGN